METVPKEKLVRAARVLEEGFGEIFACYVGRLEAAGSPLLADPSTVEQLRDQAGLALRDAATVLRGEDPGAVRPGNHVSEEIGTSRARLNVHPSESLRAVQALSQAALSVVAERLPPSETARSEVAAVAIALQGAIMERVARGAVAYGDYLLGKLHEAHADERRRIGRELHDRVAHTIMVAFRNLELFELFEERDPAKARVKLRAAKGTAQEAVRSVRELATELRRRSEAVEGLEVALGGLLEAVVPPGVRARVSVEGDESPVPAYVRDELFLMLREAVLNAVEHSEADSITVELSTPPGAIVAVVEDDGRGLWPGDGGAVGASAALAGGTGLDSMRERAAILGGSLRVHSVPLEGTRVEVNIPLARRC